LGHHIEIPRNPTTGFLLRDPHGIGFVHELCRQYFPADSDHLVSERDDRDVAVSAAFDVSQPLAKVRAVSLHMQAQRVGALDKELPGVRIPALADPSQRRLPASGVLTGNEPEPRRHITSPGKHPAVADRGDDRRRDHRADAGDRRGTATQFRLPGPLGQVTRRFVDLDIQGEPSLPQAMEQRDEPRGQSILRVFKDRGKPARKERAAERDDDPVLEQQGRI